MRCIMKNKRMKEPNATARPSTRTQLWNDNAYRWTISLTNLIRFFCWRPYLYKSACRRFGVRIWRHMGATMLWLIEIMSFRCRIVSTKVRQWGRRRANDEHAISNWSDFQNCDELHAQFQHPVHHPLTLTWCNLRVACLAKNSSWLNGNCIYMHKTRYEIKRPSNVHKMIFGRR